MEYSKNDYFKCGCGSIYLKKNKYHHIRTHRHINFFDIDDEKINKSLERQQEYSRDYFHKKARVECDCGGYYTHSFASHYRTNRHINFLLKNGIIKKPIFKYTLND